MRPQPSRYWGPVTESRRYDEREVGLILERVAELHQHEQGSDGRSMTKAEIEQVVAELGISKALVARAVSEVSVRDLRNRPVWWLGGKTDLMFEHRVQGSIDDATLTRMLEVLRRSLADPGRLEQEGASRIWSTTSATTRRITLTVVDDGDATTVRLEERMPGDARTTVGGTTFGTGFLGVLSVIPLKVLVAKSVMLLALGPVVAAGATAGWLAGRALWRRRSQSREEQLRRAFGELVALAEPEPLALSPAGAEVPPET